MSMAAALGVEGDVPFAEINGFPTDEIIGVRSGDTSLDLTLPSTAMMPPHEPLIIISRRDSVTVEAPIIKNVSLPQHIMGLKLISATPSPYARKVRISLAEKGIPFELQTEVPWDSTTKTPFYNPLEKLPVLIPDDGPAVYESYFILEWLEAHYPPPKYPAMYPEYKADELLAKQVQVVTDGMCDACVLLFFEKQRKEQSGEWKSRQLRKVQGGLAALSNWVCDKTFIVNDKFSLADIAAGSVLGYMKVRFPDNSWQETYPNLRHYLDKLEERESFKSSTPTPQKISDKIV